MKKLTLYALFLLSGCSINPVLIESYRSPENIEARFAQNKGKFFSAYRRELIKNPGLSGKAVFEVLVDPAGHVLESKVIHSTFPTSTVPSAVNKIIEGMFFGEVSSPNILHLTYPITFSPE